METKEFENEPMIITDTKREKEILKRQWFHDGKKEGINKIVDEGVYDAAIRQK